MRVFQRKCLKNFTLLSLGITGFFLRSYTFEAKENFKNQKESLKILNERLSLFETNPAKETKKIFEWIASILEDFPVFVKIIEENSYPSM
jgi:hypothetical protein